MYCGYGLRLSRSRPRSRRLSPRGCRSTPREQSTAAPRPPRRSRLPKRDLGFSACCSVKRAASRPAVRNLCFVWVPRVSLRQGLVHITSTMFSIFDLSVRKNFSPFFRTFGVFLNPLPSHVQTSNMGAPYRYGIRIADREGFALCISCLIARASRG